MKTVYFFVQGQFANHLFQYFAAEIIKKIFGYDEVKPTFHMNLDFFTIIDDTTFKEIITQHIQGITPSLDTRRDILMTGFFQRSEIFKHEYDYLRSLFHSDNMNHISNRVQIGNIVKYQSKHNVQPTENDLTLHLRCGDFWDHEKNRSQIFDPESLKEIIRSIPHQTLYIVRNKPDFDWENRYYEQFNDLQPVWINGNMADDFDFLMRSKKLITSASTYSYMAAYLGNANEIHIPYNAYYGGFDSTEQSLADFNDKCKVYYNVNYWFPKKTE
jgi:hypothetical protein